KLNNSPNNEILNDARWLENFCFGLTIPPERKRALGKTINRRWARAKVCDGIVRWRSGYLI
ncbi:hypothetical protein, partial [cf. Phormidesmis sp. LEGE 11477]|uniref:hypothetical protein n=1 Tax=cf. Phormidesmis sp. LEGE 11477 TaxID=1828680 RepID=UPI001D13748A